MADSAPTGPSTTTVPSSQQTAANPSPANPSSQLHSQNPPPVFPTTNPAPQLTSLAQANFIRPRSTLRRTDHPVQFAIANIGYESFCRSLFSYLDGMLVTTYNADVESVITEASFVRMCNTLLIFRVQQVRQHRLSQRPAAGRILLSRGFEVPAALAEILSGIGDVYLESQGRYYAPSLPPAPDPAPDYYTLDPIISSSFQRFVDILKRRQLHRAVPMSSEYIGSPFWFLGHQLNAGGLVTVTASHQEATPADGLLASMVKVSNDLPGHYAGFVYADLIGYQNMREIYFASN